MGIACAFGLSTIACNHDAAEEPAPARIVIVSGNNQEVRDGARLEPMTVRVTRAGGAPSPNVEVHWTVAGGFGEFHSVPDDKIVAPAVSLTNGDGVASIYFLPSIIGGVMVTAAAEEVTHSSVNLFARNRPRFELVFGPTFDCTPFNDPSQFSLNRSAEMISEVNVPIVMSYASYLDPSCTARVKTTVVPDGGQPFDSGIVRPGDPFLFTPRVAGTWVLTDVINGGGGKLIVR